MTLFVDPSGFEINAVEVDGSQTTVTQLFPSFFLATMFFQPLFYLGGLSDLFCAKPDPDQFSVAPDADTFIVPPGKTKC
jgi:hypothetical protein